MLISIDQSKVHLKAFAVIMQLTQFQNNLNIIYFFNNVILEGETMFNQNETIHM